jgi:hypothetical protein
VQLRKHINVQHFGKHDSFGVLRFVRKLFLYENYWG